MGTKGIGKVINAQLYEEDERYYLHLEYEYDRTDGMYKLTIPKVHIPLEYPVSISHDRGTEGWTCINEITKIEFASDLDHETTTLKVCTPKDGCENIIMEKQYDHVLEVTMDDIEKRYGCKVKIING